VPCPDHWSRFQLESRLGECLAGLEKYAEAEPLLLAGYEGLKAREKTIPADNRRELGEAVERLVRLCDAWGKPDKANR
jgi:hypothetical protein